MSEHMRDLDALIEAAKVQAASGRSDQQAAAVALRMLAGNNGHMTVEQLLARGVRRDVIAALVDPDTSTDKRRRPMAQMTIVRLHDGTQVPTVTLLPNGWKAAGRPSGKAVHPTAESLTHAMAPQRLAAWLQQRTVAMANLGAEVGVTHGPTVKVFSDEAVARAWARLRVTSDATGKLGAVTGGVFPDALIVERFSTPQSYAMAWSRQPDSEASVEHVLSFEYESRMKNSGSLAGSETISPRRHHVEKSEALIELGMVGAVIHACSTQRIADALAALGVGDPNRRPGQLLIAATTLGLDGEEGMQTTGPTWWPTRLPSQ